MTPRILDLKYRQILINTEVMYFIKHTNDRQTIYSKLTSKHNYKGNHIPSNVRTARSAIMFNKLERLQGRIQKIQKERAEASLARAYDVQMIPIFWKDKDVHCTQSKYTCSIVGGGGGGGVNYSQSS